MFYKEIIQQARSITQTMLEE